MRCFVWWWPEASPWAVLFLAADLRCTDWAEFDHLRCMAWLHTALHFWLGAALLSAFFMCAHVRLHPRVQMRVLWTSRQTA
jgi:hypothetical protein